MWAAGVAGLMLPSVSMVYVSAEDDENELARRAQAIKKVLKLPAAKQGQILSRKGKDSALVIMGEAAKVTYRPFYYQLKEHIKCIPGHKVVVLDSAYDFVRFADHGKIDEDSVNFFIKIVLQGLCDDCDATLLIPWHPSRSGSARNAMDGWSVAWHNAARARPLDYPC